MSGSASPDYDTQTINAPNPLARYAHRTRLTKALGYVTERLPDQGSVVDFGAGNGDFLAAVLERRPDVSAIAVEPFEAPRRAGVVRYVRTMRELPPASADLLSALEVCEHLEDETLPDFVADAKRVIKPTGWMVVSVPIMIGAAAVAKEVNRQVFKGYPPEHSIGELLSAMVGGPVSPPASRRHTHKGFDFRKLRKLLETQFVVRHVATSPLSGAPWFLNSQIFFLAQSK